MSTTPSQLEAIDAEGNVLVAAGAGAGKTSTLVQRCVQRLLSPERPASVDEILMVTFTEAAAAEMRSRVRGKLEEELALCTATAGDSRASHIEQQLALLETAHICTLHSFCFALVRDHFHQLEIDPQIRVLDEAEAMLLKEDTLDSLFKRYYSTAGPNRPEAPNLNAAAVQELIQVYGEGKERPIRELLLRLHEYTQTRVNPEQWYAEQKEVFSNAQPRAWRAWLMEALHSWKNEWQSTLNAAPAKSAASAFGKALAAAGSLETPADFAAAFANAPNPDNLAPKDRKPERFFDEAAFLRSLVPASDGGDPLAQDWEWTRGHMLTLLRLAHEFFREYANAKREAGTVDFHDLEQFSLRLLVEGSSPTAIAREYQRQFRYVFVDECQDINAAQDAILRALSREPDGGHGPNRFLVGDVKQSIYRFRLADPAIFQRYEAEWDNENSGARVIRLSDNFRSREALVDFFNAVFRDLMHAEAGGIRFTEAAELKFGAPEKRSALSRAEGASPRVHVHLRLTEKRTGDESSGEEGAELNGAEQEARIVANALRDLHATKHQVWDDEKKCLRDAGWGDMAVLLRSPTAKADLYAREFARQNIPLQVAQSNFFESIEATDLLNLLSVLDNPIQDVPLIAVLHSPFCGLTENELAEVRLALKDASFWAALSTFHAKGAPGNGNGTATAAAEKIGRFMERFKQWREMGRDASLSYRLQVILAETHYLDWLIASAENQQGAEQRSANIRRFLALAEQFDPWQRQGISRFLRFVDAQRSVSAREPLAARGDAVQLISIHRSKGLEYPVVVVPDLGKKFNFDDLRANIILHSRYGLCPTIKPPHTRRRYPGLTHWLASRQERTELLGEEVRLLYVAMTRARDTLLLVGSTARSSAEKWLTATGSTDEILQANTALGWLGPWLARNAGATWLETTTPQNALFSWRIDAGETEPPRVASSTMPGAEEKADAELISTCRQAQLSYPHMAAAREAAKTSVSLLRRRMRDEESEAKPWMQRLRFEKRPANGRLGAAEVGLAHHTVLELANISSLGDETALRAEIAQLIAAGSLRQEEADNIDIGALAGFWSSEIGRRIAVEAASIRRELPFTARFGTDELRSLGLARGPGPENEFAIVQGVVDLAVILQDEIWLLDFKTDAVTATEASAKAAEYRPQIVAYAAALQRIYRRPVTEKWLHFLAARQTVSL